MALDTSFCNWNRGNRITQYAGLTMSEGVPMKFGGPNYSYIDIPVEALINAADGSRTDKLLRNQVGVVIPACQLDVKGSGYQVQVEPNPAFCVFGPVQGSYYVHPGSGRMIPSFYVYPRKDFELTDVSYGVRLYLRG